MSCNIDTQRDRVGHAKHEPTRSIDGYGRHVGLTAAAEVARANTEQTEASLGASAMNHRSYRGKMLEWVKPGESGFM